MCIICNSGFAKVNTEDHIAYDIDPKLCGLFFATELTFPITKVREFLFLTQLHKNKICHIVMWDIQ